MYMHSSVATLKIVEAGAVFYFSDARSNKCCKTKTVVNLGKGAASPLCADSLLSACFSFAFEFASSLLPAFCYLAVRLRLLLACFQLALTFSS